MGWGTYLITPIYFSKETYRCKYDVERELTDTRERISRYRERLKNLAFMTEPQKFCPSDCGSVMVWIEDELDEIFSELDIEYTKEYKLSLLLDAWDDCHDEKGNAIVPNEPLKIYDMNYCGGDFIKEVYPDGTFVENNLE